MNAESFFVRIPAAIKKAEEKLRGSAQEIFGATVLTATEVALAKALWDSPCATAYFNTSEWDSDFMCADAACLGHDAQDAKGASGATYEGRDP